MTAISRRRTAAVALCLRFSTREIVATDSPVEVLRAAIDMPCSSLQKLERRLAQPGTLNNASVLADTARHQLLRLRSRLNGSFDLVMNLASGAVPDLMLRVIEGTTTVANMVELERPAPVPRSACRPASATRGRHRVTAASIRRLPACPRSYEEHTRFEAVLAVSGALSAPEHSKSGFTLPIPCTKCAAPVQSADIRPSAERAHCASRRSHHCGTPQLLRRLPF